MIRTAQLLLVAIAITCIRPVRANAVSWSPLREEQEEKTTAGIIEKGGAVCLFQSGTADVRKEIHVNDVLTVYREDQGHTLQPVGSVKVLSFVGDDYLKGEVVRGEVQAGDIAKKGDAAGLVISSGDRCK